MGCSASRSYDFVTTDPQNPWNCSSSSHSQQSPYSYSDSSSTPVSRTLSLPTPLVHHPAMCKGDTNHLVSLTSTTYGSLVLIDTPIPNPNPNPNFHGGNFKNPTTQMIKSLNGTDPQDPLSPDSVINTWELMEGLDDFDFHIVQSKIESPRKLKTNNLDIQNELDTNELEKSYEFVEHSDSKPLWKHLSEEQLLAKMDPNVASSYRQALSSKRFGYKESEDCPKPNIVSSVELESSNASLLSSLLPDNDVRLKGTEDKIVLYFTSLRGIRKTYEECCTVRMIFRGFRVCVDERDVSMDASYRKELQSVLEGKTVSLPQVFIGGKYIGGAEEIKQLHEAGELANLVEGFAVKHSGFVCESCGDARFVPCPNCSGSRKVFEEEEGKLRRCLNCNENGLIRCPGCCP
ncbi:PREDICTED: uncharacterized protein At5g39865 [Nicotiana attenuata]|uniref:Glutaredoxin domain-containing protein n=1 Tax=Nicotiana attenuata TaxID=49451 RepID=A0A1J6KTT4_NICAT|nr:PREDICTED: uncharacterized protein At5g39865 [Nicotiana attenuata]OIT28176.1 uncharacterized protein A4A49_18950 [Nicotiana attenuata]